MGCLVAEAAKPKPQGGGETPPYQTIEVISGGRLTGRVVALDPPPPHRPQPVTKDEQICGREVPDERLIVGKGGALMNAVVSVEGILHGKAIDLGFRPRLDNVGCRFVPHVLAVAVGQKLEVRNSDPLLHNTHATFEGRTTVFNLALPVQNQRIPKAIEKPGLMKVECDAGHVWMSAWIHAFEHPYYAVTGEDGSFTIDGLPPGTYTVRAWHEELGTQSLEITIHPGASSEITFGALAR